MKSPKPTSIRMEFEDNGTLALLTGEHNANLAQLEQALDVSLDSFGNSITITGPAAEAKKAQRALEDIYRRLGEEGADVPADSSLIRDAVRWVEAGDAAPSSGQGLETWKKKIIAKTPGQTAYLKLLRSNEVVFGLGPAGTGKTYLAVAKAVESLKKREVERIVLSRPAVEAGERLGFLPGDMKEKVDPYLRPLYDALHSLLSPERTAALIEKNIIEVAPLAYMRGRTLAEAFVILDEAQNTTTAQMRMVLTRLGENSRMVVTGDPSQVDLPGSQLSGLVEAAQVLDGVEGIAICRLTAADVVRHPLVQRLVQAYARRDAQNQGRR